MAAKRGERRAQLDALGIDAVCARIEAGESLSAIAAGAGVGIATLHQWIGADAERSARARDARERSAHAYADLAEQAIDAIADDATQAAVTRQREKASHYRWMARVRMPGTYGDKVQVAGDPNAPVKVKVEHVVTDYSALREKLKVWNEG